MAPPDLNSLPPSAYMSSSPRTIHTTASPPNRMETPSPRPSMNSLAAAASLNAADNSRRSSTSNRGSPRLGRMPSDRRRSQVAMSLNLNDPAIPSPGELSSTDRRSSIGHAFSSMSPSSIGGRGTIATGDPHHQRQPSLGDLHNELEQEQEAQVNRMLQMIREQQLQLDALRAAHQDHISTRSSQPSSAAAGTSSSTAAILDELTPASERSITFPSVHPAVPAASGSSRRMSRNTSSANRSPALRPLPGHEINLGSSADAPSSPIEIARRNSNRDESAYYQAETAALTRENQMLRLRIRELEKQIAESTSSPANAPVAPSNLVTSPPLLAQDEEEATTAAEVTRVVAQVSTRLN